MFLFIFKAFGIFFNNIFRVGQARRNKEAWARESEFMLMRSTSSSSFVLFRWVESGAVSFESFVESSSKSSPRLRTCLLVNR